MSAGLYIHVPFCKTKCPYCDFYSITDLSLIPQWLGALRKEMAFYQESFSQFDSLFIGGGTPSLLDENTLSTLIALVRACRPLTPDSEITIEANPDDITERKVVFFRSLGINRLSLGVQSFNDEELSFLRRRHTSDGARRALESIRSGFDNFGIDLIYGLKGQTDKQWLETLEEALSFQPTHLSCYQLTVEPHTPFGLMMAQGDLAPLTEAREERLFLATSRFLEKQGFIHYEVSNFARTEDHFCRHNMKYWNRSPYLGLGPSAHSFTNGRRWWNYGSFHQYCASLTDGARPVEDCETLSPDQVRLENLSLGFRTKWGVDLSELGMDTVNSPTILQLEKKGLIKVRNGRVVPTRKGFLMADRLPLMFSL